MSEQQHRIEITLIVALVGSGGNTGDGKYFYSYTPNLIMVENPNTIIEITLVDETNKQLRMTDMFACDPNKQFKTYKINSAGNVLQILDANTAKELIPFSVLVETSDNEMINCDPQASNKPPN